jgi:hypothetical protein
MWCVSVHTWHMSVRVHTWCVSVVLLQSCGCVAGSLKLAHCGESIKPGHGDTLLLHLKLCHDTMCAKYYCQTLEEVLPTSEQMSTNSLKTSSCCMTVLIACSLAHRVRPDWMLHDERRSDVRCRTLKAWRFTPTDDVLEGVVQLFRQQPKEFFADATCQHWDSCLNACGDICNSCITFTIALASCCGSCCGAVLDI